MTKPLFSLASVLLAGVLLLTHDAGAQTTPSRGAPATSVPQVRKAPPVGLPAVQAPRLVISVVLDQFASWTLERYRDRLPNDGFLREAMAQGAYHERVAYEHAITVTAVGHCTLYTGAPPSESGVSGNAVWEPHHHRKYEATDDHVSSVLGSPADFASPLRLRAEGVADVLRRETSGKGRIVSLSIKDRGAVYPGGRHPLIAVWYDGRANAFTTSTYYDFAHPKWLAEWNRTRFPAFREREAGSGEAFTRSSRSIDALLDLSARAIDIYELGVDDVPDLLAVSISTTDLVGHAYGADSEVYVRTLIAADRALAKFLKPLLLRGRTAVLISSDHGAGHSVEAARKAGHEAHIVSPSQVIKALEAELDHTLGNKEWVEAAPLPRVYLYKQATEGVDRAALLKAAAKSLEPIPGVRRVYDARALRAHKEPPADFFERSIYFSLPVDETADLYLLQDEYSVLADIGPKEGHHGSPYAYDQEVPVILYGHGVTRAHSTERTSIRRVAATLARLLRIAPPVSAAKVKPLEGVE